MAVVAVANTSTYIQGGIEYDAYVSGSNIVVNVRLYFRRTNAWSGQTYSSSVGEYICISGDPANYNYSQTGSITVAGGQQDVWQGAFFSASRTFDSSRGGNTIYVGWKTNDNVSSYFTGSNNIQITLPTVNTPPTGLKAENIIPHTDGFSADVSITDWGVGSGTRWKELQCWTYNPSSFVFPRRHQIIEGSNLSDYITVNNQTMGQNDSLNIVGNTRYTIGVYATNGAANTDSQRVGNYATLAYAPSLSATMIDDSSVLITYSLQADGGFYAKNVQYSLDGGTTWVTGATINTGSATTGTFIIGNLSPNTAYNVKTRVSTTAGETNGNDVSFTTLVGMNFLGPVNSKSKSILKFYAPINRKSKLVKKLYGPDENGKSKLFYQA